MTEFEQSAGCNSGSIEETGSPQDQNLTQHVSGAPDEVDKPSSAHETSTAPTIEVDIECYQPESAEGCDFDGDWRLEMISRLTQLLETMRVPVGTALLIEIKATG